MPETHSRWRAEHGPGQRALKMEGLAKDGRARRPREGWQEQTEVILDVVPQVPGAVEDFRPRSDVIIFGL